MAAAEVNTANKTETEEFLENYRTRIADIISIKSGRHAPDQEAVSRWISAQVSLRRRQAAQALIANLRYISHAEIMDLCNDLIREMYTDPTKPIPVANQLKWFVGPKDKSSYFIAIACYYFAEQAGYRLPDVILSENFNYRDCENSTVFYLDDMSYSGSQMQKLLRNIHIAAARANPEHINKRKPVNMNKIEAVFVDIRVGTCVITERGQETLEAFSYAGLMCMGKAYGKPRANPYKMYTMEVIPDLKRILGPQMYTDCILYFNPFYEAPCICYFDHKLADPPSTFTNVLRFGVVPQNDLNYRILYGHEDGVLSQREYKPFLNQRFEQFDKQLEITQFIPFIKGCDIDPGYKEQLQGLPYHILMMYSNTTEEDNHDYYMLYDVDISKNPDLYKYKNTVDLRCPKSWYKDNYFSGGTRKRLRSNQNRSRKGRSTAAPWPRKPRGHSRTAARSQA